MSNRFADQLRRRMDEKNQGDSSKERLAEQFNDAAGKLIYEFLAEVKADNIRIDDTADLMRLMQIYKEINDISEMSTEGTGSLPALSPKQSAQIKTFVETEDVMTNDGEEESYITPDSLAEMSAEDVQKMMQEREIQINEDNAKEWGSEAEMNG